MATASKKRAASSKKLTETPSSLEMIKMNQSILKEHYNLLTRVAISLGQGSEQDVVRMFVADGLRRKGLID